MSNLSSQRKRHNRTFWLDHITQWKQSGLSKIDYCRRHQLSPGNFYNWCSSESRPKKKIKRTGNTERAQQQLIPVTLLDTRSPLDTTITLDHAAGRLSFPANLSPEHIQRWLGVLGQADD